MIVADSSRRTSREIWIFKKKFGVNETDRYLLTWTKKSTTELFYHEMRGTRSKHTNCSLKFPIEGLCLIDECSHEMRRKMEEKGIEAYSVTFHSMFIGMMKCKSLGLIGTRPVATCWNFLPLHCKLEEEPMMRLSAQRQTVERGRCVNETVLTFLSSKGDLEKLEKLKRKTQKLRSFLPPHGTELS
ncbi:BnaC04g21830D [Brassica napus]|uniref:(rape) hypothetical protein n=1 Tax=Brassica napus TaxID=3708 RepID=A0A078I0B0_BRANA|nr:unnamed protein product [Brassica napus]CDY42498.1 BnaC04g21830D [Brassica napus]